MFIRNIYQKLKSHKAYYILSCFFSFFLMCSWLFYYKDGITKVGDLFIVMIFSCVFAIPFLEIFIKLNKLYINVNSKIQTKKFEYHIYVILLFISHFFSFLILYPGLYIYDVGYQIYQYDNHEFNKQHPLLHTYLLGKAKHLFEDANKGFAWFTLLQMLIVELAMAYAIYVIYKRIASKKIRWILLLYYGIFPINNIMTISITKDILFSACMLIFVIDTYKLFDNQLVGIGKLRYLSCGIMMLLLRNNAKYAFVPFLIISIYWCMKKRKSKIPIMLLAVILISAVVLDIGLERTLQADKGPIREMLSVPAQEMAFIHKHTKDMNIKNTVEKYITDSDSYITYLADPIKGQLSLGTIRDMRNFILDTVKLNIKCPVECLDAVLYLTQGFWDIFHNPYSEYNYFLVKTDYKGGAVLDSKLPIMLSIYEKNFYQSKGCLFMNQSIYIWFSAWALLRAFYDKKSKVLLVSIYPIFYLMTLILSPGAILRYAWIYILMAPLMLVILAKENYVERRL